MVLTPAENERSVVALLAQIEFYSRHCRGVLQANTSLVLRIQNLNQNSEFQSEFRVSIKIQSFNQNSEFQSEFRISIRIQSFNQNSESQSEFRVSITIQSFNQNSKFQSRMKNSATLPRCGRNKVYHKPFHIPQCLAVVSICRSYRYQNIPGTCRRLWLVGIRHWIKSIELLNM